MLAIPWSVQNMFLIKWTWCLDIYKWIHCLGWRLCMDIDIMAVMECTEYVLDKMDMRWALNYVYKLWKKNQWQLMCGLNSVGWIPFGWISWVKSPVGWIPWVKPCVGLIPWVEPCVGLIPLNSVWTTFYRLSPVGLNSIWLNLIGLNSTGWILIGLNSNGTILIISFTIRQIFYAKIQLSL